MAAPPANLRVALQLTDDQFNAAMAKAEARTRSTAANMNRSWRSVDRQVTGLSGTLRTLSRSFGIGFGIGAAAIAIERTFSSIIRATKEFEKGLSSLSAITGATGKDLEFMGDAAKELSRTSTQSATGILRAFQLVGSAKAELLENADALKEVTAAAITLSEASGDDVATAAHTLTTALNQFGAGADQATRFINVLAAGAQRGAIEIPDLSVALEKSGTVAKEAGLSFEQLVATLEILGQFGTPVEKIGTSLRNIFIRLLSSADQTNPKVVGFTQAVKNLGAELTTTAERAKFFGAENIVVGNQLIDTIGKVDGMTEAVTGTNEAVDQAATRTDNLSSDLDRLSNDFETLAITMGGFQSGVLRDIIQGFDDAVQATTRYIETLGDLEGQLKLLEQLKEQARRGGGFEALPETEQRRLQELTAAVGAGAAPRVPTRRTPTLAQQFRSPVGRFLSAPTVGGERVSAIPKPPGARDEGTAEEARNRMREEAAKLAERAAEEAEREAEARQRIRDSIEATIASAENEALLAGKTAEERERLTAQLALAEQLKRAGLSADDEAYRVAQARLDIAIKARQAEQERQQIAAQLAAVEKDIGQDIENLKLRLRYSGEETEEYRVQVRLLELKRQLEGSLTPEMEAQVRQAEALREQLNKIDEAAAEHQKEMDRLASTARDFGLTFTSAFEDAVIEGKSLRDVINGIITDLERAVLRKGFTEPFLAGIGGLVSGETGGAGIFGVIGDLINGAPETALSATGPGAKSAGGAAEAVAKMAESAREASGSLSSNLTKAVVQAGAETALSTAATTAGATAKATETGTVAGATVALGTFTGAAEAAAAALASIAGSGGGGGAFGLFGSLLGGGGGGAALPAGAGTASGFGGIGGFMLAGGGPVRAGRSYIVGEEGPELFRAPMSGDIIPNDRLGGGGTAISQQFNISTGVAQTVRAEILSLMPMIQSRTVQSVLDAKQRGGNFAGAFSR